MIGEVLMKGRKIIVAEELQQYALEEKLHNNHMGIEKARLLVCESINCIYMNSGIENTIKYCSTYLDFKLIQPKG